MAKRSIMDESYPVESSASGVQYGFRAEDLNITSEESTGNGRKKKRGSGNDTNSNAGSTDQDFSREPGSVVKRRKLGRPLGSKNKPKAPLTGIHEISDTLKTHILEVPHGFDVIQTLAMFVRSCELGVFVMSGSGKVSNVMLLQPAVPEGMVAHARLFQLVSLSGAFPRDSENEGATGLRARLVDAEGKIVAGTVIGSMTAYDRVTVMVGTAANIQRERLNVQHVCSSPDSSNNGLGCQCMSVSQVPMAPQQQVNMGNFVSGGKS